jgi:hypothetical protein
VRAVASTTLFPLITANATKALAYATHVCQDAGPWRFTLLPSQQITLHDDIYLGLVRCFAPLTTLLAPPFSRLSPSKLTLS